MDRGSNVEARVPRTGRIDLLNIKYITIGQLNHIPANRSSPPSSPAVQKDVRG